jgi:Ca2+-binding RTX toxin-like protein
MTVVIDSSNSVFVSSGTAYLVPADTSLLVLSTGYLISSERSGIETNQANTTYDFQIFGRVSAESFSIYLVNSSNSVVNIDIQSTGHVTALTNAIFLSSTSTNLTTNINNSGEIYSSIGATIFKNATGVLNISNSGTIFSSYSGALIYDVASIGGRNTINNSGLMDGASQYMLYSVSADSIDTITNSGIIGNAARSSQILLGGNSDRVTLSGSGVIYSSVNMGDGTDTYIGGLARDIVNGDLGNDGLWGNGGADFIKGGDGADKFTGGPGRDWLWGWDGVVGHSNDGDVDTFYYNALTDSGITAATRDVIVDFVRLSDKINLVNIDANALLAGNQAFSFDAVRGAALATGQLGYKFEDFAGTASDRTIIAVNTDGDSAAEFTIELTGFKYLSAADFFL